MVCRGECCSVESGVVVERRPVIGHRLRLCAPMGFVSEQSIMRTFLEYLIIHVYDFFLLLLTWITLEFLGWFCAPPQKQKKIIVVSFVSLGILLHARIPWTQAVPVIGSKKVTLPLCVSKTDDFQWFWVAAFTLHLLLVGGWSLLWKTWMSPLSACSFGVNGLYISHPRVLFCEPFVVFDHLWLGWVGGYFSWCFVVSDSAKPKKVTGAGQSVQTNFAGEMVFERMNLLAYISDTPSSYSQWILSGYWMWFYVSDNVVFPRARNEFCFVKSVFPPPHTAKVTYFLRVLNVFANGFVKAVLRWLGHQSQLSLFKEAVICLLLTEHHLMKDKFNLEHLILGVHCFV